MNRHVFYQRFVASLGLTPAEFQERFAREVTGLTVQEMRTLKATDLNQPETWTEDQIRVFRKMFARTVVKAKRMQQTS